MSLLVIKITTSAIRTTIYGTKGTALCMTEAKLSINDVTVS